MTFLLLATEALEALSHGAICGVIFIIATATVLGKKGLTRITHPANPPSCEPMTTGDERPSVSVQAEAKPVVILPFPIDEGSEPGWYFEPWALLGDQT